MTRKLIIARVICVAVFYFILFFIFLFFLFIFIYFYFFGFGGYSGLKIFSKVGQVFAFLST